MRVHVYYDEWYPIFVLTHDPVQSDGTVKYGNAYEMPEVLYQEYVHTQERFSKLLKELECWMRDNA